MLYGDWRDVAGRREVVVDPPSCARRDGGVGNTNICFPQARTRSYKRNAAARTYQRQLVCVVRVRRLRSTIRSVSATTVTVRCRMLRFFFSIFYACPAHRHRYHSRYGHVLRTVSYFNPTAFDVRLCSFLFFFHARIDHCVFRRLARRFENACRRPIGILHHAT